MSLNGAIAEAVVLIRADGDSFQSDVVRQGTTAGTRAGSAFGDTFKRRAKATLAVGGAALFAGVTAGLRTGFGELTDYETGLSNLRAGLKSTKGVVGLTAKDMEKLASRIQHYSGQTDDSIVATEQLLLTFTNIRNEAGKNNDIFTQTTKIAADMAQRMGGDASSAAIQLGKALNDPVKGITALTRVGVAFTEDQKKQIETLVKHGDTLKAQKIILHELNTEFGGSARQFGHTLPGQIEKTKRAYEDITQQLAADLLPAAKDFTKWVRKDALPALEDFGGWIKDHKTELEWFGGIIAGLAVGVKALKGVRSLQALVGKGPLGGGGGLLGSVTQRGSTPANPLYVVDISGSGGLPGRGKVPVPGKGKRTLPLGVAGPLTLAYAATQGGDQAPGQGSIVSSDHGIVGQRSAVNYSAQVLAKILGSNVGDALHSTGSFKVLDTGKAVSLIETKGTKEQIAALKDLAGRYDNVRAALKEYKQGVEDNKKSQADLNQILGVTKGKVNDADSATHHFATSLFGLSKGAKTAGLDIGTNLGLGLIQGIEAQIPHATQQGKLLVSLTAKQMRLAAEQNSPSKVTMRIGEGLGEGLIVGMQHKEADLRREADHMMGQLDTLRSGAQALASGIRGAILGDSSILNTPNQTVGGIKSYFRHVLGVDRQFTHRIDRLRHGHQLPKGFLNELEQDGPIAAGNIVRQLIRADRGDQRDVARLYRNIHHVARSAGRAARQETFDPQIKEVVDQLKHLNERIDKVSAEIRGAEHRQSARTHRP